MWRLEMGNGVIYRQQAGARDCRWISIKIHHTRDLAPLATLGRSAHPYQTCNRCLTMFGSYYDDFLQIIFVKGLFEELSR